ncbi:major facilitator superfamily domain-containing protein [Fusarium flagelliforme]|uniref:major facilitator superfamily domain-containing protein n=1 Tax=Fusarium flagelliforme TaxID=2675880 RepID=UPI001E8E2FBA|nr:major facilitator superfamily domain-containing protein [Fusarium flagelliforme]KAH7193336.1 major facilitator superfamily domain-containing protein [Fusarium flagelliforme]
MSISYQLFFREFTHRGGHRQVSQGQTAHQSNHQPTLCSPSPSSDRPSSTTGSQGMSQRPEAANLAPPTSSTSHAISFKLRPSLASVFLKPVITRLCVYRSELALYRLLMPSLSNTERSQRWPTPLKRVHGWFTAGTTGTNHHQRELYPLNFWLSTLALFLVGLGSRLLTYPWPNLLETSVCRYYYEQDGYHGEPSPEFCADERVIRHWVSLVRLMQLLSPLAAIVAQIPMGILVDKGRRRLAFILNITSTVLYWGSIVIFGFVRVFPLWCFYISPVFLLVGGGSWATSSLVYAVINNTVRPEQRTTAFSFLEGLSGLSGLVGPLLYNETMRPHLWVSYILALILYSLALVPTLYLTRDDNLGMDNEAREDEIPEETEPLLSAGNHSAREAILSNRSGERSLAPRLNIFIICFACFFSFHISRGSISYTFVWVWLSFGHDAIFTELFTYIRAIVLFFLLLIVLPLASSRLDKTWRVAKRDLILSSTWIAFCAVGTLIILVAPNLAVAIIGFIIATLGYAMPIPLRSFLASHFEKNFSGRLFAGIGVVENVGWLIDLSLMQTNYYTEGAPYVISLVTYAVMLVLLIRLAIKI